MAETKRMTAEQVVGYLLEGEGLDFLRESLAWVVQQLMEAEVSELIGAARGERAPAERLTYRNGYRSRTWSTRAGEIELAIPKIRRGSYFVLPRAAQAGEQALVAVVQEAYVAGVSTRKVDQLVESLGLRVSKSEVSRICAGLDEQVEAFRNRPLEGRYPYLWLDAKVEKVRDGGRASFAEGARPRLRRPREWLPGGDRPRRRRVRDGSILAQLPARARQARPARRAARRLRRARRPKERDCADARLPLATLHRALLARDARPCPQRPAGHGRGAIAANLQR